MVCSSNQARFLGLRGRSQGWTLRATVIADSAQMFGSHFYRLLDVNNDHQPASALRFGVVVRGVMRDMAMDQPLAALARLPDHVIALARSDVDRVSQVARRRRNRLAVARHHLERPAMDVHGMD